MSSGFRIAGEVFWGTNGAVEAFVDAIAEVAKRQYGPADSLANFFYRDSDDLFTGRIVDLDDALLDTASREHFLQVFDAATEQLLQSDILTESGKKWLSSTMSDLRNNVAAKSLCRQ